MFTTILSAAVLTVSLTPASSQSVYLQGDAAHVPYSDLDLGSGPDRQRLVERIEHAARRLCDPPGPAPLLSPSSETECVRIAIADGVAQMNTIIAGR